MSERGLGWKPELRHRRVVGRLATQARYAARVGAPLLSPNETFPRFDPWILEQGGHLACTGHNGAGAVYEKTGEKASPWGFWQWGLVIEGHDEDALPNEGLRTSAMLRAFSRHGSPPYEKWNPSLAHFYYDAVPSGLADVSAQRFNISATPLFARGQQLVDLLVDGMAQGASGGIVVKVDAGIEDAKSDPVGPESGPSRGYHITTLRRALMVAGRRAIETTNSWGVDAGDEGLLRLSAERAGQAVFAWLLRDVS